MRKKMAEVEIGRSRVRPINGDPAHVSGLTTMLSDGAERLVEVTGRMLP